MRHYKIDDQVVIADKELSAGQELVANTSDGAGEKHVPVISKEGNVVTVKVGEVEHPSLPAHFIGWILIETASGFQIRYLKPGMKPEAVFTEAEPVVAAYEYCNLHGLWKAEG